jgi:hypothetical protein
MMTSQIAKSNGRLFLDLIKPLFSFDPVTVDYFRKTG